VTAPPPEIVALERHHASIVAALSERCLKDAWSDSAVANVLATPGTFGFIAMISETPTAFILCRAAGGECEVLALGTDPSGRRKGLAHCLVKRTFDEAGTRKATRIVLEVAEDNRAARDLYARCGLSQVGRRPRYYRRPSGFRVDALILAREWSPDDAGQ